MKKTMRKTASGLISVLLLAATFPAQALDGKLALRGSLAYGKYDIDQTTGPPLPPGSFSDDGKSYGGGLGLGLLLGRAFVDLGIDYYEIKDQEFLPDFVRTDATLTVGARIIDWLSAFGGFRKGWQDLDSAFQDDYQSEQGFYVGSGVGPFKWGPIASSLSLAYNFNKVDVSTGSASDDISYDGVSAKIRFGVSQTPHAVELRFQKFEGEEGGFSQEESYAYLAYVFTWNLLNF